MNAIGGFFELELNKGQEYHKNCLRLNSGRSAFEYILRARGYSKVYLPFYTCDVLLQPINKLNINYEFYHIDENLFPQIDQLNLFTDDVLLYTNYFGVCDRNVDKLIRYNINVIIDNAQSFFSRPFEKIDSFNSARKFFGVPDGSYLFTSMDLKDNLEFEKVKDRMEHLLSRIEDGPKEAYAYFKYNDNLFSNPTIKQMSRISHRILESIDYNNIIKKRMDNFNYLHDHLMKINMLNFDLSSGQVPMVYPLYIEEDQLRETLIKNQVFIAKYWPNVEEYVQKDSLEYKLTNNILPLPIDQRYDRNDMAYIVDIIQKNIH